MYAAASQHRRAGCALGDRSLAPRGHGGDRPAARREPSPHLRIRTATALVPWPAGSSPPAPTPLVALALVSGRLHDARPAPPRARQLLRTDPTVHARIACKAASLTEFLYHRGRVAASSRCVRVRTACLSCR